MKLGFFAAVALAAAQAAAQPPQFDGAFFALSVENAATMAEWYRAHLGFRTLEERRIPEREIAFALLERQGSLIEIIERRDTQPAPIGSNGKRSAFAVRGIFKIGFHVTDLEQLHDRMEAAHVPFDYHIVQPEGNPSRTFAVRDPEGNIVQFFGR